jgi:hypothetical protein
MKYLISFSFLTLFALNGLSFSQDSAAPMPASAPPIFSVDSIAFAGIVTAREPMGVNSEFPSDIGKLSCWVRIVSPQAPVIVRFQWFKNGEKVMEWPYSLKTESGRLWSTKSVTTGNWKVDIVDEANNVVKSAVCEVK